MERLVVAARVRDDRRRVVLAEQLAEVEVHADDIAKQAVELATNALPAMLEALKQVLARPKAGDPDLLERLVQADPERARQVLDTMAGTT